MMVFLVAPVAAFTFFAKFNIALFAKLRVLTVCPSGLNFNAIQLVQNHHFSAVLSATNYCKSNLITNFCLETQKMQKKERFQSRRRRDVTISFSPPPISQRVHQRCCCSRSSVSSSFSSQSFSFLQLSRQEELAAATEEENLLDSQPSLVFGESFKIHGKTYGESLRASSEGAGKIGKTGAGGSTGIGSSSSVLSSFF